MKKRLIAIVSALALAVVLPCAALAAPSPSGTSVTGANNVVFNAQAASGTIEEVKVSTVQASNVELTATEQVLASFEVNGDATDVTLTFSLGSQYAGASARVFVEHNDGTTEIIEAVVSSDGLVTVHVDGLSIFTIAVDTATMTSGSEATGTDTGAKSPYTGVSTMGVAAVSGIALIAAAGCGAFVVRKSN